MLFLKKVFLIFSSTVPCKELGIFVLHSVHHDVSFELSKTAFAQFLRFFMIRGSDPSDKGGFQISLSRFIVVLQSKLKMFCDQ